MALVSVKLLGKVVHKGRFHEAGKVIELEAEHAEKLVEEGVAEAEGAAKRVLRKARGGSADTGDGDPGDGDGE